MMLLMAVKLLVIVLFNIYVCYLHEASLSKIVGKLQQWKQEIIR